MSERDLELLSAYLDNALTADERTQLESRLAAEPDLARELERLRLTQTLVRGLPTLQAPRPLTVTRDMVAPPRILVFPATVAFSALSAAAAIIVLLAGVILLSTARDTQTVQNAVAVAPTPAVELFSMQATEGTDGADALLDEAAAVSPPDFAPPLSVEQTVTAQAALEEAPAEIAGAAAPPVPQATMMAFATPLPFLTATLSGVAEEAEAADAGAPASGAPEVGALRAMSSPTATLADTKAPTITLSPTPPPTIPPTGTPLPVIEPDVQVGDGSSVGVALIVIAALLFLLSATAFVRRGR